VTMAYTPIEVLTAVVRRVGAFTEFNPRDFEVALSRRPSAAPGGEAEMHRLPGSLLRVGEPTRIAAERASKEMVGLRPARSFRVGTATHPKRCRTEQKMGVVFVVVPRDPRREPEDLGGYKTSYFNIGDVVESPESTYPFLDDHRELLYHVIGWIRQLFASDRLSSLMPVPQRKIRAVVINRAVQGRVPLTLDRPAATFTNQHFLSGTTLDKDGNRVAAKTVTGLSDLDVDVGDGTDGDAQRRESFTETVRHDPRNDMYAAPNKVRGKIKKDATRAAAPPTPQSLEDPNYASVDPSTPQGTVELQVTHHASRGPTPRSTPQVTATRSAGDTLPQPPPAPASANTAPPPPPPPGRPMLSDDQDLVFGFNVDEEVDEVSAALAGLRREKEGSRRSVGEGHLSDSEHPLFDDLNGDFTNPLSVH